MAALFMSWLYSEEDVTRVVETETHYAPTALVWGLPSNIPPHVNRSGRTQSWASCGLPLTDCDANMCQMRSTAKRLLLYFCGALSPCIVASGTCQEAAFLEVHLVSACLSMHTLALTPTHTHAKHQWLGGQGLSRGYFSAPCFVHTLGINLLRVASGVLSMEGGSSFSSGAQKLPFRSVLSAVCSSTSSVRQ